MKVITCKNYYRRNFCKVTKNKLKSIVILICLYSNNGSYYYPISYLIYLFALLSIFVYVYNDVRSTSNKHLFESFLPS